MSQLIVPSGAKEVTIEAVVIRANGRREELGTVAYWHRNPLRRFARRITNYFTRR